jgi:SAM-dependent methyltransferase
MARPGPSPPPTGMDLPMVTSADAVARERRLVGAKQLRYSVDFAQYYHRWYNDVLLGLLTRGDALRVLDCGCGTGVLLPAFRQRGLEVVGLDLCLENLLIARDLADGGPLVVGDVGNLPVAPCSFDQIVCRGVLHRLPEISVGLEQLFAALKPGGELVISEPIGDSRALGLLRRSALAAGAHPFPGRRIAYLTTREWIAAAHAVGFHTEGWFHLGYLAFPLLGFPEAIAVMRRVPRRLTLARLLVRTDEILARLPFVSGWSWQAVFHFRKPPPAQHTD